MPAVISPNILPQVGNNITVFYTYIDVNNKLQQAPITNLILLYGSANTTNNVITPTSSEECAICVVALVNGADETNILYLNILNQNKLPNNRKLLTQKFPKGTFNDYSNNAIIGNIVAAQAKLYDDYYNVYFGVLDEVYSTVYSSSAEFQYNGTIGLLSDSFDPNGLFLLLYRLKQVKLTSYYLELFVSQYIYYRLGVSCAIFANEGISNLSDYWTLNESQLDTTTILAPNNIAIAVSDIAWTIYNSSSFSAQFQQEITLLINRISRADMQNIITFSNIALPTSDGFTLVGATYELDPNILYGKCLAYIGDSQFPLNIIGYIKNA